MDKQSFTAADNDIPVKILHHHCALLTLTEDQSVPLTHLQLCPTNRCNLNCEFCSCADRKKDLELSYEKIQKILDDSADSGCTAVTITGGGEPLLHNDINNIIKYADDCHIGVGLVTNGLLLDNLNEHVDWCRISFDSSRDLDSIKQQVIDAKKRLPDVDWAFSFVLYDKIGQLEDVVRLANDLDFTHVRVVSDIHNPDDGLMFEAQVVLTGIDERVIFQPRSKFQRGKERCLVSLLRPTIGADGNIYPCCGAQYAINGSDKDFVDDMCMGGSDEIIEIWKDQRHFNGSKCDVCYYSGYNNLLELLLKKVRHESWV